MIAGALISTQAINILWDVTQKCLFLTSQNLNGLKLEGTCGNAAVSYRRKLDPTRPYLMY